MNTAVHFGRFELAVIFSLMSLPLHGGVISTFTGIDPGVGPGGAHINSQTAANSFATTVGSALGGSINFENMSVGTGVPLSFGGGSLTATNAGGPLFAQVQSGGSASLGFNTTPGGTNFFQVNQDLATQPTVITFNFADPISAFGAYISGLGTSAGSLRVWFDDGQLESLPVEGNASGGVLFFGFLSDAKTSAVHLQLDTVGGIVDDGIGIDDVVFTTPEPGSIGLFGVAAAMYAFSRFKRK
jgi:hypothetical protein